MKSYKVGQSVTFVQYGETLTGVVGRIIKEYSDGSQIMDVNVDTSFSAMISTDDTL